MDRKIARTVKTQPMTSSTDLQANLKVHVSASTIRRRLCEAKLPARSPRKVPLLQKRHVLKRLQFAKEHVKWPKEKWRNVLWTDESKIVLYGSRAAVTLRGDLPTLHSNRSTLKTKAWWCQHNGLGMLLILGCWDLYIAYRGLWTSLATSEYLKRSCYRILKRKCP